MNLKLNTSIDSVYDSLTEFTNQLNKNLSIVDKNESKAVYEIQFGDNWSGIFIVSIKVFKDKDSVLITTGAHSLLLGKKLEFIPYSSRDKAKKYQTQITNFLKETLNAENLTSESKPAQPKKKVVDEDIVEKTPEIKEIPKSEKVKESVLEVITKEELKQKDNQKKIFIGIFIIIGLFFIWMYNNKSSVYESPIDVRKCNGYGDENFIRSKMKQMDRDIIEFSEIGKRKYYIRYISWKTGNAVNGDQILDYKNAPCRD